MSHFRKTFSSKTLGRIIEIKESETAFIKPFKEMPSLSNAGQENINRINAHDLFSFYTADIIREDIIYAR